VLGRATGNTDTQDSPRPGLGGSHHLPPYSILCTSARGPHPNGFSFSGLPKSRQLGLLGLWSPIILRADLRSWRNLKQSCSSCRELSNDMWRVVCNQVNRVDSWLFVVGSQIGSSTPGLSFGHNLCFRCPNEQCEPILDIYVPRAFHWYKERHKTLSFDPSNSSLKFWESTRTPSPKVGVALGVWVFTPSHSLALPCTPGSMWCDSWLPLARTLVLPLPWFPGFLPLGPQPCNPFALVASPKLGLRQLGMFHFTYNLRDWFSRLNWNNLIIYLNVLIFGLGFTWITWNCLHIYLLHVL
jgi:hypothetical protein